MLLDACCPVMLSQDLQLGTLVQHLFLALRGPLAVLRSATAVGSHTVRKICCYIM